MSKSKIFSAYLVFLMGRASLGWRWVENLFCLAWGGALRVTFPPTERWSSLLRPWSAAERLKTSKSSDIICEFLLFSCPASWQ